MIIIMQITKIGLAIIIPIFRAESIIIDQIMNRDGGSSIPIPAPQAVSLQNLTCTRQPLLLGGRSCLLNGLEGMTDGCGLLI